MGEGEHYQLPDSRMVFVREKDYDRMMSENAEHFDVLKEGI